MRRLFTGRYGRSIKDLIVLLTSFILLTVIFIRLDLFEGILETFEDNERHELDEFILSFALLSVFLLIFAVRRWGEQRKISAELAAEKEKFREANEEIEAKAKELDLSRIRNEHLGRLVAYLQVSKSVEEIHRLVGETFGKLFPGCSGAIYDFRNSRDRLTLSTRWGEGVFPENIAPGDCWGLRLGKEFFSVRDDGKPRCRHSGDDGTATACIPMAAHGEVNGLFHVRCDPALASKGTEIPPEIRQTLMIFADQIGLALSNISLNEKLKDLAIHDPLTGLFNRQYLDEIFERELHRAERLGFGIGVLMMDIDHFKVFNDTFGHSAGDAVLEEMGRLLKRFFRAEDFCCRYGGEEFLILATDATDAAGSGFEERLEELRASIAASSVVFQNASLGAITASMGAALFPKDGNTAVELIEAADKALYRAKEDGRNCVRFA